MISISNIAWKDPFDNLVLDILKKFNIKNIEIAITKINGTWDISTGELNSFMTFYKKNEINIYSAQSINYKNDSNLFYENKSFLKHIYKAIEICGFLGIKKIVFGSPKNRLKKPNDKDTNFDGIFIDTMINISEKCNIYDIIFCIEPNSTKYNCNYIVNSIECLNIINVINKNNIKIHLDSACMHMENDYNLNHYDVLKNLEHYHISSPFLGNIHDNKDVEHNIYSNILNNFGYKKAKTIEMVCSGEDYLKQIEDSIIFAKKIY
jgi:sugar phosphate isomerase/epimerase